MSHSKISTSKAGARRYSYYIKSIGNHSSIVTDYFTRTRVSVGAKNTITAPEERVTGHKV